MSKISLRYGNIIICGDFNLPKIHWELPEETTGIDEIMFTELLSDYFQTQLNTTPTRGGNVVDLVISNSLIIHEKTTKEINTETEFGYVMKHLHLN